MDPIIPPPPRARESTPSKASETSSPPSPPISRPPQTASSLPLSSHPTPTPPPTEADLSYKKIPSSEDVRIGIVGYHTQHPVHIHGPLAQHHHTPVHPPQHLHQGPETVNYAQAAKEEMHELAQHPPTLGPGAMLRRGHTGVKAYDRVVEHEMPSGSGGGVSGGGQEHAVSGAHK